MTTMGKGPEKGRGGARVEPPAPGQGLAAESDETHSSTCLRPYFPSRGSNFLGEKTILTSLGGWKVPFGLPLPRPTHYLSQNRKPLSSYPADLLKVGSVCYRP